MPESTRLDYTSLDQPVSTREVNEYLRSSDKKSYDSKRSTILWCIVIIVIAFVLFVMKNALPVALIYTGLFSIGHHGHSIDL